MKAPSGLEARIGYTFRDPSLLRTALTHASYVQEHGGKAESNQRLEFLGDAVLQLVLAEALFALFPGEREGPLTKRRSVLGNGRQLAQLARELGIDRELILGTGEESGGGRNRDAALEDAFEALVGAVRLDGGLDEARRVTLAAFGDLAQRLSGQESEANPKGRLQEMVQPRHGNQAVRYEVDAVSGEDHCREFSVSVFILDRKWGSGSASSKKLAEERAAQAALERIAAGEALE